MYTVKGETPSYRYTNNFYTCPFILTLLRPAFLGTNNEEGADFLNPLLENHHLLDIMQSDYVGIRVV